MVALYTTAMKLRWGISQSFRVHWSIFCASSELLRGVRLLNGRARPRQKQFCALFAVPNGLVFMRQPDNVFQVTHLSCRQIQTEWESDSTVLNYAETMMSIMSLRQLRPARFKSHPAADRFCFWEIAKRLVVIRKSRT